MYRYNHDNAVTYTPDDLDLFRESPFAIWMERLTLENPDHGIPPDRAGDGPGHAAESPDSIVETLRAEGRQVAAIDPELAESERRAATLGAMREGADFIVNGQLAAAAFSTRTALLMRTSGYSDLGDFLYIPCEPEAGDAFHTGFRLSFVANLLHSLQGQLPPQMLIIRDGADVVPLQTEDHIHYYRSVQGRFQRAMSAFRKHRMPDPSESSHFGRWSGCASEVLKQRALRELARAEEAVAEAEEELAQIPPLRVASGVAGAQGTYDTRGAPRAELATADGRDPAASLRVAEPGHTLAEQARLLEPGRFRVGAAPGHTPNLARFPRADASDPAAGQASPEPGQPAVGQRATEPDPEDFDASLQNLEFIGSNGLADPSAWQSLATDARMAPAPSLRRAQEPDNPTPSTGRQVDPDRGASGEPRFLPPDPPVAEPAPQREAFKHPGGSRPGYSGLPGVDLDSAPAPTLAPVRSDSHKAGEEGRVLPQRRRDSRSAREAGAAREPSRSFDDRLHTSADFEDD